MGRRVHLSRRSGCRPRAADPAGQRVGTGAARPGRGLLALVLSETERRVVAAVDELFDEELAFAQALVRIPTINPPGRHYADCAELVQRHLATLGYTVEVLPAE